MAGTHASGRTRHSSRTKVEGSLALDVNVLAKAGCLQPGREAEWQWNHNSGPIAAVEIVAEASRLNVSYNRYGIDAREPVIQAIDLIRVPRHFGGSGQTYFICPCGTCNRRAVKLYAGPHFRFLCRRCLRLLYASQYDTPLSRAVRRARKAEQRLGDMSLPKPKGKGMWLRTCERLLERAVVAEALVDEAVVHQLNKLLAWADAEEGRMMRNRPSRERKA